MAKRKPISKKTRFEVFKRDGFKCQYCGRSAPDVVLEVDHIVSVAEGGPDEMINLITSCRDCNRGKGKRLLSDDAVIQKQMAQLDELNEKREQMEMLIEWKKELLNILETQTTAVDELIQRITSGEQALTEFGKNSIKKLIKEFGFEEVYTATEIAFEKYYKFWEDEDLRKSNAAFTFEKIGGICHNRKKGITKEAWVERERRKRYGY